MEQTEKGTEALEEPELCRCPSTWLLFQQRSLFLMGFTAVQTQ